MADINNIRCDCRNAVGSSCIQNTTNRFWSLRLFCIRPRCILEAALLRYLVTLESG